MEMKRNDSNRISRNGWCAHHQSHCVCVCFQLNRRVHNKPFERCYPYINYRNLVVGHCNIFWVFVWFWLANVNIWNRNWSTNIECEVFESNCDHAIQNRKTTIVFTNRKEPPYKNVNHCIRMRTERRDIGQNGKRHKSNNNLCKPV